MTTNKFAMVGAFVLGMGLSWVHVLSNHKNFESLVIKPEIVPDFIVTYNCDDYQKMQDIHMVDHGETVSVNYGGFGRHRYTNFVCLDQD